MHQHPFRAFKTAAIKNYLLSRPGQKPPQPIKSAQGMMTP
jgi:hypothetical protein